MTRDHALGGRLVTWRHDRAMKQSILANYLNVTRQRLWDWETHGVPAGDVVLVKLAMRQIEVNLRPTIKSFSD